jgi:hypothetical protein
MLKYASAIIYLNSVKITYNTEMQGLKLYYSVIYYIFQRIFGFLVIALFIADAYSSFYLNLEQIL